MFLKMPIYARSGRLGRVGNQPLVVQAIHRRPVEGFPSPRGDDRSHAGGRRDRLRARTCRRQALIAASPERFDGEAA